MSSTSQGKRGEILGELARELRQFNGLGASFFRAAAGQAGMTVTDMQVIDILDITGLTTAGRLAELTGLTTGAITGMLNRLEEAGLVRRERDPNDGRKVIVRLERGKHEMQEVGPIFDSLGKAWDEIVADYSDEQIAFLLDFIKRSNVISRQEIVRLREAPTSSGEEGVFSAPLGDLESAQLIVTSGAVGLNLRTDKSMSDLYQVRFKGTPANVKAKDGTVTIRYPRRLMLPGAEQRAANVTLNPSIPWQIVIQGGTSEVKAKLEHLKLSGLEVKGGLSTIELKLPVPLQVVPIRLSGGASTISVTRPAGVPARVHLKGWASMFVFDYQTFTDLGNDVRLQSSDYKATAPCYDIDVSSSASMVTITTEE
jgi:DNA-binding MarR family transcriptional regulator